MVERSENFRPVARNSNEAGFTVLEMLVSLVLLALVMGMLTVSLRGFDSGFARGVSQASRQDMLLTAANVVRRDLSSLPRVIDERGERAAFRFEGSEAGVSVVTRARPRGAYSGLALVRYEIVRQRAAGAGSGLALLRHQSRFSSSGTAPAPEQPAELIAGPFEMRFAYLQAGPTANAWLPAWSFPQTLPAAIRLTISDPSMPALAGLLLVVPLRADAEAGCVNPSTQICTLQTGGRLSAQAARQGRGGARP